MTGENDFERIAQAWVDDGDDRLPDHHLRAALAEIESTRQRGARGAPLEGLSVTMSIVARIAGAAVAIVLVVLAYRFVAGPNTGGPDPSPSLSPSAQPSASAAPSAREVTEDDLADIVVSEDNGAVGAGWTLDATIVARSSIMFYPTRSVGASEAAMARIGTLQSGIATEFSAPDAAYISWVALFRTEADAEAALAVYLADFVSLEGWGLEAAGTSTADGPEGAVYEGSTTHFLSGPAAIEPVPAQIRIWRVGNLLLAMGGFFDYDADSLHFIGDNMVGRARTIAGVSL